MIPALVLLLAPSPTLPQTLLVDANTTGETPLNSGQILPGAVNGRFLVRTSGPVATAANQGLVSTTGIPGSEVVVADAGIGPGSSDPQDVQWTDLPGGVALFFLPSPDVSTFSGPVDRLWRSDGTEQGTFSLDLLEQIAPNDVSGLLTAEMIEFGGRAYVLGRATTSDATTLFEIDSGATTATPLFTLPIGHYFLAATDDALYIALQEEFVPACVLQSFDPQTGTRTCLDPTFSNGLPVLSIRSMTGVGDRLVYAALDAQSLGSPSEWWSTGAQPGTHEFLLASLGSSWVRTVGGRALFAVNAPSDPFVRRLGSSDGTAAGTTLVTASDAIGGQPAPDFNGEPVTVGSALLFSHRMPAGGVEPAIYTPTTDSFTVFDVTPGPGGDEVDSLTSDGATGAFYSGSSSDRRLWSYTTGDPAPALLGLNQQGLFSTSNDPTNLAVSGSLVLFQGFTEAEGFEPIAGLTLLPGTLFVNDLTPGTRTNSSNPAFLARLGSRAFFSAQGGEDGSDRLWSTEGTDGLTVDLGAALPGPDTIFPTITTPYRGRLLLDWKTGLASTDGTLAGTRYEILPGAAIGPNNVRGIATLGDRLIFLADDAQSGDPGVYATDLTLPGTERLAVLPSLPPQQLGRVIVATPTHVFFAVGTDAFNRELWSTDGTPGGTQALPGLFPGSTAPLDFSGDSIVIGTNLYVNGWTSDGTPAGTRQIVTTSFRKPQHLRNAAVDGIVYESGFGNIRFLDLATEAVTLLPQTAAWSISTHLPRNRTRNAVYVEDDGILARIIDLSAIQPIESLPPELLFDPGGLLPWVLPVPGSDVVIYTTESFELTNGLGRTRGLPGTTFPAFDLQFGRTNNGGEALLLGSELLFSFDGGDGDSEPHSLSLTAAQTSATLSLPAGCPDTATLTASGSPTLGNTVLFELTGGSPAQVGQLLLSSTLLPPPAVGTCNLSLFAPNAIHTFALDGAGATTHPVLVPTTPALLGLDYYLQAALLQVGGPILALAESTNALELVLGGPGQP